jgi:hypothetical protein
MRNCNKCNTYKELTEFYKNKYRKDGLNLYCKLCNKEYYLDNKEHYYQRSKQHYLDNQEKYKEHIKQHRENNKEHYQEYSKQYRENNKEYYKEYIKQHRENNKESHKEYSKQHNKQRRQNDPLFKLSCNIRTLISFSFKNKGYRKNTKTEQILGCTIEEFKIYIEKQFIHPMSFDNYGPVWEIDHITPISSAKTEEDIITLNHYTNLRPLFKTTEIAEQYGYDIEGNRNKSNKISPTTT